jgi:hypothetical protein
MSAVKYATALRCIGQDLVRRDMKTFEITVEGGHFVLCGRSSAVSGDVPEVIRYTPADIELLDRSGECQRGQPAEKAFLHEAQMLRAIGEHLDKYNSVLIRVAKSKELPTECPFQIEYCTREGEQIIDDRPGTALFDMCVLMVQKRRQRTRRVG